MSHNLRNQARPGADRAYIHIHTVTYIHIHMHIHTHSYIHIHTHTYTCVVSNIHQVYSSHKVVPDHAAACYDIAAVVRYVFSMIMDVPLSQQYNILCQLLFTVDDASPKQQNIELEPIDIYVYIYKSADSIHMGHFV